MRAWQIYYNGQPLQLEWSKQQSGSETESEIDSESESVPVLRICCITDDFLVLLAANEYLYSARLQHKQTDDQILSLQLEWQGIQDVDYCEKLKQLYLVTNEGLVLYRTLIVDANFKCAFGNALPLSFDPLEISEEGIRIRRVKCSEQGVVFVTYTNKVYVLGNCGDIFATEFTQPKCMRLFDEHSVDEVIDIVAGNEFFILLLRIRYDEKLDVLELNVQNNIIQNKHYLFGIGATTSKHILKTNNNLKHQSTPETETANKSPITQETQTHQDLASNSSLHSYSGSSIKSSQSSHDFEAQNISQQLLRHGFALLHTQVHTFGSTNNGVLGTGDHIKRGNVNHIAKLDNMGVCCIAAGCEHSLARTLDGRLFHWGLNSKQQLQSSTKSLLQDLSAPTEIEFDNSSDDNDSKQVNRILAACCGDFQTVLLNASNELSSSNGRFTPNTTTNFYKETDIVALQLRTSSTTFLHRECPLLLSDGDFTVHNQRQFRQEYHSIYASIQAQFKQLLKALNVLEFLEKFQQRQRHAGNSKNILKHFQLICLNFRKILYLTAAALKSFESFYRMEFESPIHIIFIKHHRECIAIFELYTRVNCDLYSIDGYAEASKILAYYANITQTNKINSDHTGLGEIDLASVFQKPLQIFPLYIQFLERLSKTQHEYAEHLLAWQSYARQNKIDLELAENTLDFWQRNERNMKIRQFRKRQRRVILTSNVVPLRLSQHGFSMLSKPTFILFSDCLCQLSDQLHTYPLVTMWLKIESDTSLRITTPEKSFSLIARSHHDKMLWYDQLESSILAALGRPSGSKISSARTTMYVFSNSHNKYAGVHAYGRWRNGILHGNCYLEYPDGKFYCGDMRNGEIEGFGKMIIPSVGLYEGTLKAGKFHGYGTYEMKENDVYEGNFKDGMFHGHGLQRNNNYTYVGEYQANTKCGYGVLDDMLSGDKYMGMFVDNKRIGAGTCITMLGDYFEGIFTNNELSGPGIAVFENNYYYEGTLNMNGPNGNGTYYMPNGVVDSNDSGIVDNDDISNRILVGNVLNGQLSGSWQDVRVLNGNVALNSHFQKYPKAIGKLVVDDNRKWRSLFENFEEQIFGLTPSQLLIGGTTIALAEETTATSTTTTTYSNTVKMIWNRIAVYMTTQREREKALEQQDTLSESKHSYFARNISLSFGSRSFDRMSLKSTSLMSEATVFDFRSSSSPFIKTDSPPKRSQSQETLYNDSNIDLNELDYYQQHNDELHSLSGFINPHLTNWANDTMNGIGNGGAGYAGTTTSSLRSSYDSVFNLSGSFNNNSFSSTNCTQKNLEFVPSFGITTLNESDVSAIKDYLVQAFKDRYHPLYVLNQRVANCFYISYGCWKVKPTPILAKQAMHEWETITRHIYKFVRKLFPALPEDYCVIESTREVISHINLLYPIVLTEGIYSTLFVLYANKFSRKDEMYRQNLIYAEKLNDSELATQLGLENALLAVVRTSLFAEAIQTLKQLQEKYSPKAMLSVIELCMQLITDAPKMIENAQTVILAADSMMPLTLFLVLRAAVPHLGAELALLDDLTGGDNFQFEMNGITGYCYTTLKAAYEHITTKPFDNKTS